MQRVGFKCFAGIFLRHLRELPGARDVNRQCHEEHQNRHDAGLDVNTVKEHAVEGFVDDVKRRQYQEARFHEGGEIFKLAVTVGMSFVGGLVGNAEGQEGDDGCDQIQSGVQRFAQDTKAARADDQKSFQRNQQ
jgi:hypothetical protein